MFKKFKTALVLAPHTDDGELGCGGTLAKLIDEGVDVHYVAFSLCEESLPEGYEGDVLATELLNATGQLGIPSSNVTTHDFPVRRLCEHRQDILEILVKMNKILQPDVVFMPSLNDIHQDHEAIAREGLRAFKRTTILAYELIWNNIDYKLTAINELGQNHIDRKVKALNEYKSQKAKGAQYLEEEFITSMARVRGLQINKKYAEAFEVVRWIM
jgi:LmbE family N-acetylglucosaminyl deacetylase